jgi:hypothetical protein
MCVSDAKPWRVVLFFAFSRVTLSLVSIASSNVTFLYLIYHWLYQSCSIQNCWNIIIFKHDERDLNTFLAMFWSYVLQIIHWAKPGLREGIWLAWPVMIYPMLCNLRYISSTFCKYNNLYIFHQKLSVEAAMCRHDQLSRCIRWWFTRALLVSPRTW